jgi:hypothetical protein
VALTLYYSTTAPTSNPVLITITALLTIISEGLLITIGLRDPGFIPKIFPKYER